MQRRPSGSGDAPPRLQKMKEPSQGIGLIAVAVAGVAALWWWRKIATDDVEDATTSTKPANRPTPTKATSGNAKKDRSRKKEQRAARNQKRQQQQQRSNAPEPEAVVKDERSGIDGSMLYLNHTEFTGKSKSKKR